MNLRVGLGTRLNLLLIFLNLIILSGVAYLAVNTGQSILRNIAIDDFSVRSEAALTEFEAELTSVEMIVLDLKEGIAQLDNLNLSSDINSYILTYLEAHPNTDLIHSVSVLRPDGSVVRIHPEEMNATLPSLRVISATDAIQTDPFQTALSDDATAWFVQEQAVFDLDPHEAVTVAVPYDVQQGRGLIWIDIRHDDFREQLVTSLNSVGLLLEMSSSYALVADTRNQVVDLENGDVDDLNATTQLLFERMFLGEAVRSDIYQIQDPFLNNQEALINLNVISINDWSFVTVLPVNEMPAIPFDIYLPISLMGLIGVAVLVYTVNRFIDIEIVKPLTDLGRSAAEMGEGNLRFIVFHQDKRNEIGRLASAMDSMRNRLRDQYDELAEWGQTLESRVRERTEQVRDARQQAETTAAQLQAVYDESLSVVNETQLQPVLDAFIDRILMLLNATYCAVWLLEDDRLNARLVATNDPRRRINTGTVLMDARSGIVGQAIRLDQPIIVNDYKHYEHRVHLKDYYAENTLPFHRGVCAPLKFAGSDIGAIVVGRDADSMPFNLEAQRQLTLFSNMVSPSVRNAQLFNELQEAVQEAKKANEVKTRFLASVTHELRTPLNLIINNIDFMRVGAFGDVTPDQVSRLNQTVRSAEHLLYLINDLLDVSKIEAGEMQLFIQKQEIYTMLEDAMDNAYALLDQYDNKVDNVSLRFDVEDTLPEIPVDARRIRQVLNNLLSNGIKFTKEGTVTLKVFKLDNGVHFSVHDTGMGIPQSEMRKLFAAFERTNAAKQNAIEGTGLGLPISRYLVKQHGSDLTVTSEVGVGTTFAFTLPFDTQITVTKSMSDTQQITAILSHSDD